MWGCGRRNPSGHGMECRRGCLSLMVLRQDEQTISEAGTAFLSLNKELDSAASIKGNRGGQVWKAGWVIWIS